MMKTRGALRRPTYHCGKADTLSDAEFHLKEARFRVTERDGIENEGIAYESAIIGGDIEVGKSFTFTVGDKVHATSNIRAILLHSPGVYEICTNNSFYLLERAEPVSHTPSGIVGRYVSDAVDAIRALLDHNAA